MSLKTFFKKLFFDSEFELFVNENSYVKVKSDTKNTQYVEMKILYFNLNKSVSFSFDAFLKYNITENCIISWSWKKKDNFGKPNYLNLTFDLYKKTPILYKPVTIINKPLIQQPLYQQSQIPSYHTQLDNKTLLKSNVQEEITLSNNLTDIYDDEKKKFEELKNTFSKIINGFENNEYKQNFKSFFYPWEKDNDKSTWQDKIYYLENLLRFIKINMINKNSLLSLFSDDSFKFEKVESEFKICKDSFSKKITQKNLITNPLLPIFLRFNIFDVEEFTFKELQPEANVKDIYNRDTFFKSLYEKIDRVTEKGTKNNKTRKFLIGVVGISGAGKTYSLIKLVPNIKNILKSKNIIPLYITFNNNMTFLGVNQDEDEKQQVYFEINTRLIYSFLSNIKNFDHQFDNFYSIVKNFSFLHNPPFMIVDAILKLAESKGLLLLVDEISKTFRLKHEIRGQLCNILSRYDENALVMSSLDMQTVLDERTKSHRPIELVYLPPITDLIKNLHKYNLNLDFYLNAKYRVLQLCSTPKLCMFFVDKMLKDINEEKVSLDFINSNEYLNSTISDIYSDLYLTTDLYPDEAEISLKLISRLLENSEVKKEEVIFRHDGKPFCLKDVLKLAIIVSLSRYKTRYYRPIISELNIESMFTDYDNNIIKLIREIYSLSMNKSELKDNFEEIIIKLEIIMNEFAYNGNSLIKSKSEPPKNFTYSEYFTFDKDIVGNKKIDYPTKACNLKIKIRTEEFENYDVLRLLSKTELEKTDIVHKNIKRGTGYDYSLNKLIDTPKENKLAKIKVITFGEVKSNLGFYLDYPNVDDIKRKYFICEDIFKELVEKGYISKEEYDFQVVFFTMKNKQMLRNDYEFIKKDFQNHGHEEPKILLISYEDLMLKFYSLLGMRFTFIRNEELNLKEFEC